MLAAIVCVLSIGQGADASNDRVLAFARSQLGKQVGDGECTSLAVAALREAGLAARFDRKGAVWGEPLEEVEDARPGDILQLDDVTFFRRTRKPSGAVATVTATFPHHTAIVSGVRKVRGVVVFTILHQNARVRGDDEAKARRVSEWTLSLADLKGGTVRAFRPGRPAAAVEPPPD